MNSSIPSSLFFLLFLLVACNEPTEETPIVLGSFAGISEDWQVDDTQVKTFTFPEQISSNFNWSDYADTSWAVPLETTPESVIGKIDKVLVHKDIIYILDSKKAKRLMAFDFRGKHLFNVGQQGQGPGKYTQPFDFSINKKENCITVYEDKTQRFLLYQLDGVFIKEIPATFFLHGIASLSNGDYVLNTFGRSPPELDIPLFRLVQMKPNGKTFKKGLPYAKAEENLAYQVNPIEFATFKEEVLYTPNFLGKAWAITPKGMQLKYQIDFGKQGLPEGFETMQAQTFIDTYCVKGQTSPIIFAGPIIETNTFLFFYVQFGRQFYTPAFANKVNGEIQFGALQDNLAHSPGCSMVHTSYQDQYLIGSMDSYHLTKDREEYKAGKSEVIQQLLDQLEPTDNPVLTFYHLK